MSVGELPKNKIATLTERIQVVLKSRAGAGAQSALTLAQSHFYLKLLLLDKNSLEKNLGLSKVNDYEQELLKKAIPKLMKNIQKGEELDMNKKRNIANKLWAIPECGSKECNYGLHHSFQVKELGLCPRRICSKTQTSLKYHKYRLRQGYFRRQKNLLHYLPKCRKWLDHAKTGMRTHVP
ncbi:zinc finger protein [Culex quinquefasciatus]|uniref:Zinc finger protein n=1 Tax=Culex quinquefasciatus TaxID=7176 RepID=B0WIW4_CULQU|nr:zinc finger protein [Culex quinquefasciatus]|eukprot:XP_001848648.1 zinc finger protein [Culex quinquefasciatus]